MDGRDPTHTAASTSSIVFSSENPNRTLAYASVSERPMALSTYEGSGFWFVHAELCEHRTPTWSSRMVRASLVDISKSDIGRVRKSASATGVHVGDKSPRSQSRLKAFTKLPGLLSDQTESHSSHLEGAAKTDDPGDILRAWAERIFL